MKILLVSAHPDDIEYAMGATLFKLKRQGYDIEYLILSDSQSIAENRDYNMVAEAIDSMKIYGIGGHIHKFETMYFRHHFQEIRNVIYDTKKSVKPDIVFCCSPMASHPDHQVIGESCDSIFLECTIYCFEDIRGNQRQLVNKWIKVDKSDISKKLKALGCYKSQSDRTYTDFEAITALAKTRGLQIGAKYAEGFEVLREIS